MTPTNPDDRLAALRQLAQERHVPSGPEPARLGDVLSKLFALRGYGRVRGDEQLQHAWQTALATLVEADWLNQTRVLFLRSGVLNVGVSNSALLSELAAFHKQALLQTLRTQAAHLRIRDLKFRIAAMGGSVPSTEATDADAD